MEFINKLLHRGAPPPVIESVSNTPPAKAEHEVKVQFTREFADVVSSSSGPESLSSASSFQSLASTLSTKSSSGICVDSIPNTPQKAADTSYVNSEIPGLDDLILACGNIRLGQDEPELFPVSENLEDSTLTLTTCDSSFQLQENGQDLSQDQTFESATSESILNQTRDLSPVPAPVHLKRTGDAFENIKTDKPLCHETTCTSPPLKSDYCKLDSTKDLLPATKEPCENAALNQTRKLSSNLNADDISLVLDQTRDIASNEKGSDNELALNQTRNLSTNLSAGENSPALNGAREISTAKSSDDYLALNQSKNLSTFSNAEDISPALNETREISLNSKSSDDHLALNQTRNLSTNSKAEVIGPVQNENREISSNVKRSDDYLALNQKKNLSTDSNVGEISPVLNKAREILSIAKASHDTLALNQTRDASAKENSLVLSPTAEIPSNTKTSDDYFLLNQTRNLSTNSNVRDGSPVGSDIHLVLNQGGDLITISGSKINACLSQTGDSSLNLPSDKSATHLYQTNTDSVGGDTLLNEDSSIVSNPVIIESTLNQSADVLEEKSSKSVLNGTLNSSQESVSVGSGIGSNCAVEVPSIDTPTESLDGNSQFSVTAKSKRASFDAHTKVAAQNEKEFRDENTSHILQAVLTRPLNDISTSKQEPVESAEPKIIEAEVSIAAVAEASQKLTPEVLKNTVTQVSDELNSKALHKIIQKESCKINTEVPKVFTPEILYPEELGAEKVLSPVRSLEKDDISEVSKSVAPEIPTPEVSAVLKSVTSEVPKSELPEDSKPLDFVVPKPEISDSLKSKNPEDSKSEVFEVLKSEVPEVVKPKVLEVSTSKVPEVLKPEVPEVVNLKDPEVSKLETSKVSKTESPEDAQSVVPEASKSKDQAFESDTKSGLVFAKGGIGVTGKEQKTPEHPQTTIPSVYIGSADRFNTAVGSSQQTSASQDTKPCIPITPTKTTSNVPEQTLTELKNKATNKDPKNYLSQKQVAAYSETTSIDKEGLPINPLRKAQEVLQRSPDIQVTPIVQQDVSEHSKTEGTKSQELLSYYPQKNVEILVHESPLNLDQQQEGVTNNKVTENSGDSVEDDLDRTVTLQDLSFHSPGSENGNDLYAAFKPQQQSTTLGLDCNFEKLESAAQAVATEIYNKSLELAEESDQFVPASCDLFQDSASFEFLLARSSSNPSRDWRAESLYVKFDPLVSDVSMLPKGPTQPTSGEENGKNNVSPPTIGTPKRNPALAAIDRLLCYSPAMSTPRKMEEPLKMEDPVEEPPTESVPVVDVNMAKELELVRSTVLQLEEELEKQAKEHEKELEKQKATFQGKLDQLQAQLSQEIKNKNQMTVVVDEYEKSISRLVAERERDRANLEQEKTRLQEELQAANHHLSNTEAAFNDVHLKYERLKGVVAAYKSNEDVLKESIAENVETIKALENRYDQLKHHAMSQLEKANHELEGIRKQHEAETVKLQAMLRKADLKSNSLAEMVEQKVKENKELTQILDEVIARVGHQSD